ncbi:MAG: glutaredoxin family protein [Pseudomonadales bacterium]
MQTIILYGTDYCHLCEQAEALLRDLAVDQYQLQKIDISDDDALMDLYSLRIPVARLQNASVDLGWPFDRVTLTEYLTTTKT